MRRLACYPECTQPTRGPRMERTPVNSSVMTEIGYDRKTATLEVLFTNDTLYQYFDVPEELYEELLAAPSIGQFFNSNIRGRFSDAQV